jgi:hypothetical protein
VDVVYARCVSDDELPDVRDGLTRKERVVLWVLSEVQAERGDRAVPLPVLYGRVLEHVDLSVAELQAIVARLGAASDRR